MTRLSRYKLKPHIREKFIERFFHAAAEQKSSEKIENLLKYLLTPTEIETFAKRLEIIKLRKKRTPYWAIRDEVKVTNATITKMSNILMTVDEEFLKSLQKLIKEDELKEELEGKPRYSKGSKQFWARRVR